MKSVVFIVTALLSLVILVSVASYKFDNAPGEFTSDITSTDPETDQGASDITTKTEMGPDFTVVDENGNDVRRSDLAGKPTIVLFWASWYAVSREELAALQECYASYVDEVSFMAVCIVDGERETLESAKAFLAENQFDFPIYFDVYSDVLENYDLNSRTYLFRADTECAGRIKEEYSLTVEFMDDIVKLITQ